MCNLGSHANECSRLYLRKLKAFQVRSESHLDPCLLQGSSWMSMSLCKIWVMPGSSENLQSSTAHTQKAQGPATVMNGALFRETSWKSSEVMCGKCKVRSSWKWTFLSFGGMAWQQEEEGGNPISYAHRKQRATERMGSGARLKANPSGVPPQQGSTS